MQVSTEMIEMMWTGVWISLKFLGVTVLWCLAAGLINKGVGG